MSAIHEEMAEVAKTLARKSWLPMASEISDVVSAHWMTEIVTPLLRLVGKHSDLWTGDDYVEYRSIVERVNG